METSLIVKGKRKKKKEKKKKKVKMFILAFSLFCKNSVFLSTFEEKIELFT